MRQQSAKRSNGRMCKLRKYIGSTISQSTGGPGSAVCRPQLHAKNRLYETENVYPESEESFTTPDILGVDENSRETSSRHASNGDDDFC